MKIFIGLIIAFTSLTLPALAESEVVYKNRTSFFDFAWNYSENRMNYEEIEISTSDLDKNLYFSLLQAAEQNAEIWFDTILEGDYIQSEEALHLGNVTALYNTEGHLAAYYITYSRKAWDTGSCEFNSDELDELGLDEVLKDCTPGVIAEGLFVSPNMRFTEVDDNARADFQEL